MSTRAEGASGAPPEPPVRPRTHAVTPEAVAWAIRLFLAREPTNDAEIAVHLPHTSLHNLRMAFAGSAEFQAFLDTVVHGGKLNFGLPTFMLRPPVAPTPWRFEPPTMQSPVSQLCTAAQFHETAFAEIAGAMGLMTRLHRSVWEAVWIVCVLATEGCITPGKNALGFGVRRERIAALLASRAVAVMATTIPGATDPDAPDQSELLNLFYPEIIPLADFESLVGTAPVDMRRLPAEMAPVFDALWSLGAVQGLGSIAAIGDFIEGSLAALRPGGVAVHTMDLNLSSDTETLETGSFALLRRRDVDALVDRLIAAGHVVLPINLHPGFEEPDGVVDAPPFGLPHLKVMVGPFVATSFGLAIRKAGGA